MTSRKARTWCSCLILVSSAVAGCHAGLVPPLRQPPQASASIMPPTDGGASPFHTALGQGEAHAAASEVSHAGAKLDPRVVAIDDDGPSLAAPTEGMPGVEAIGQPRIASFPKPTPGVPATGADVPVVILGLSEAIETGLAQNPDLITLRQALGVREAALGVAQTYPFNPALQTRILPWGRQGNGTTYSVYNYVVMWQTFELAHQQRFREQNAAALLDGTQWSIHQAELQTAAVTAQLYFAAVYQRGLLELADLTDRLNKELLSVMEKRLKAGGAAAADVAMVRLDGRTAAQQAQLAAVQYQNAVLALRRQLNLPADAPIKLDGDLADFEWHAVSGRDLAPLLGTTSTIAASADRDALVAELARGRPDVLALLANVDAARASFDLARAARVPNLALGPYYQHDSSANLGLGLQAEFAIPVVNNGKPLVRQRQAELQQQLTSYDQLQAKARIEIRTALDRFEQACRLGEQTRSEASQQFPEELKKLEKAFHQGEIDIVRITQARNSLILLRRAYLDSLNEVAQAAAAVTAASGLPPAALVSRRQP